MRRGSKPNDRFAAVGELDDSGHLLVGQFSEPKEQDHQVGGVEGLEAGDVRLVIWFDDASLWVDGKQDCALEPVMYRKDLGKHRHAFFGSIFVIAGDKYDVFSSTRTLATRVDDPWIGFRKA